MKRSAAALFWCEVGFFLLAFAIPALAQNAVTIEKATNGLDADAPPGPAIVVGAPVTWTYVVSNTGGRDLSNVVVTDDQGLTVTCPATTLAAGESMVCTANGVAVSGQYSNVGTVTADEVGGGPVSDSDPSHYIGAAAGAISIEKSTNGFDADTAPGPSLPAGSPVNWTYEVTNVGSDALSDVEVTDSRGVIVSCPGASLAPGESMTCTGSGVAQPGQYMNIGSVVATLPSEDVAAASDPSHYYGQTLLVETRTNGIDSDFPPGPTLVPGAPVSWTYAVTNPGPAAVTGLAVTDDQGVIVTCGQTTLAAGETVVCTGNGTVVPGQYANVGTATATLPAGGVVSGTDPDHYFGSVIEIQKNTNGDDADVPPGPGVAVGSTVNWTYEVTNRGSDTLTAIAVTDDRGVTVTCPGSSLAAGASMTCTGSGLATAGQYANTGTVDATHPTLGAVSASDSSHYFGQTQDLDFGDAPDPSFQVRLASNGARHLLGGPVFLGLCVDAEPDGAQGAGADGDDSSAGSAFGSCAVAGADEDGVTFTTPLAAGSLASVDVVASAPCTLSAWIDFSGDGDWGEGDETLFPGGTALAAGTNTLGFAVPVAATIGTSYARFRCTTDGVVGWGGEAGDGEVEDYEVSILAPVIVISAVKSDALTGDANNNAIAEAGDTITYSVTMTNTGSAAASAVQFSDTPDANTTLVAGSVTTSSGTVALGNTAGDTSIVVNVGTLAPAGGTATVTFDVVVGTISPAVTSVSNQGVVSGSNFTSVSTDDPDAGGVSDQTVTPVAGAAAELIPALGDLAIFGLIALLGLVAVRRIASA